MQMTDIITKKKQGLALTKEEIKFFVQGYADNIIPDYQREYDWEEEQISEFIDDINENNIFQSEWQKVLFLQATFSAIMIILRKRRLVKGFFHFFKKSQNPCNVCIKMTGILVIIPSVLSM